MRRYSRIGIGIAALSVICGPAFTRVDEESDYPKVSASTLTEVKLPAGARRAKNQGDLEKFEGALKRVAEAAHGKTSKFEVLVWPGSDAIKALPDNLKQAGYSLTTQAALTSEAGKITPLAAVAKPARESKPNLLGMWIEKEGFSILVWGHFKADSAGKPTADEPVAIGDEKSADAAAETTKKLVGGSQADLLGSWSWTTIGSINYQDKYTKQLSAPSGMAAKFTFTKDGRYTKFFYIRQQTYSLVTESATKEEGTCTINADGTLSLRPTKGHYDGHTGTRVIDRDMTETERKPYTWYWEWRNEDGKRQLYIGPSREAVKPFKRDA